MTDELLDHITQMANSGNRQLTALWLVVSGVTLMGNAISIRGWYDSYFSANNPNAADAPKLTQENSAAFLHLINVTLVSGNSKITMPYARVRLADVSAWGTS